MPHPEIDHVPRGYDPAGPLLVPWAVVNAARNTIAWLRADMAQHPERWAEDGQWAWIDSSLTIATAPDDLPEPQPLSSREAPSAGLRTCATGCTNAWPGHEPVRRSGK